MDKYNDEYMTGAHHQSIFHKPQILQSQTCGCFFCLHTFPPSEITDWIDEGSGKQETALCPKCGIDSVLGDASGFPVTKLSFLKAMHNRYF